MERVMRNENEDDGLIDSDDEYDFTMSYFDRAALDIGIWMDLFYFDPDKLVRTI